MSQKSGVELIVLGTIQDGGSPHIGCTKACCESLFNQPDYTRKVVSLGLIDYDNGKTYILEATPDFPEQIKLLNQYTGFDHGEIPDGVFLSHAHIGHYSGLMYLGREAIGAKHTRVYAMPRMKTFLENNGPWSQLVELNNIDIQPLSDSTTIKLTDNLSITPFRVPHRDEYSETVGYKITGPNKKVLFIPDIDKWTRWSQNIVESIKTSDYAFLDATFYDGNEISRDMSEIPHPFVVESMDRFFRLSKADKNKVHFIHFNHTNPLLDSSSNPSQEVKNQGFNISYFLDVLNL